MGGGSPRIPDHVTDVALEEGYTEQGEREESESATAANGMYTRLPAPGATGVYAICRKARCVPFWRR